MVVSEVQVAATVALVVTVVKQAASREEHEAEGRAARLVVAEARSRRSDRSSSNVPAAGQRH